MPITIDTANINGVIVATNLNPSIFSQLWLVNQEIFSAEDFKESFPPIFSPIAVNVKTEEIELVVVPERVQVTLLPGKINEANLIKSILGKITEKLPHTPYQAVGFNMEWRVVNFKKEIFKDLNRKLFAGEENPIGSFFSESNCRFGSYLSKDFNAGRLQLDIKPLTLKEKKTGLVSEGLNLNFNFNLNLQGEDKVKKVLEFLESWESAYSLALEMVGTIKSKCETS